jgi:predicted TIM-barrel fold metal-dependent hydrolase
MRVIAIEEHFMTPAAMAVFDTPMKMLATQLEDLGGGRLADMDAAGIDVQVLSMPSGGLEELDPPESVKMMKEINDVLAKAVAEHPDRFAGFAALPVIDPTAAANELERTVTELGFKGALINGHMKGRFLDDQEFWPIFERAEALGVPIYLHPTPPPPAVMEAYFSGLGMSGMMLSLAGWGWHCETGLHALRLVLGGVFDRFPKLQVIIGHMGENIPFSLARADQILNRFSGLQHSVEHYFHENFYITTAGYFTFPPLLCSMMVLGADRIIFSVDYPFSDNKQARAFIDTVPICPADREKIAHGNVERLLGM